MARSRNYCSLYIPSNHTGREQRRVHFGGSNVRSTAIGKQVRRYLTPVWGTAKCLPVSCCSVLALICAEHDSAVGKRPRKALEEEFEIVTQGLDTALSNGGRVPLGILRAEHHVATDHH